MIDVSFLSWVLTAGVLLMASAAGCAIASWWPWNDNARRAGLPLFWGLGLAPLLLGLAVIAALSAQPGASHATHLGGVFALLACPTAIALAQGRWRVLRMEGNAPLTLLERVLVGLLLAWTGALLLNAVFLPLLQNDALEYTIVGRAIFESRTLADYPQVNPESSHSGFFGPWTHPPLYVALIYLANVLQGHADAPGLMRLWAPWSLMTAIGIVYALGAAAGRAAGLVAALMLMSTPLLFLGADAALLDALPILGLLLVAGALVGMEGPSTARGAAAGIALGLALWTHSQAVLFVPLVGALLLAQNMRQPWRARVDEGFVLFGIATVVACWPYLRNLSIFGSLISDNPLVFALPNQGWADYFRTGRGIDHWPAIIQYGWFKGWSALEAFGFSFWIMLPALVIYGWNGGRRSEAIGSVYRVALFLLACYLAGVVASTVIGLDLMIKNERYMLVIVPFVCLLSAFGMQKVFTMRRMLAVPVAVAFIALMCAQLSVFMFYRFDGIGMTWSGLSRPLEEKAQAAPEFQAVMYLREKTPPQALVLSLKPADMYYAGRRMVSYLDPRLEPFYLAGTAQEALAVLKTLGVTHVHVPNYGLPPLYNSHLHEILRSPRWATLVYQADGNQIYTLEPSPLSEGEPLDLLAPNVVWTRSSGMVIGGRKALSSMTETPAATDMAQASEGGLPFQLFHRGWTTSLTTAGFAPGLDNSAPGGPFGLPVTGGQEYGIDLDLQGRGLVRIWLRQYDDRGVALQDVHFRSRQRVLLSDVVLGGRYPERKFSRRVEMLPNTRFATLTLEHVGTSHLTVRSAKLVPLKKSAP